MQKIIYDPFPLHIIMEDIERITQILSLYYIVLLSDGTLRCASVD